MRITPILFEAFLKCPTKCWLRHSGEPAAGNAYSEWVRGENETYRTNVITRLLDNGPKDDYVLAPSAENLKSAGWRWTLSWKQRS